MLGPQSTPSSPYLHDAVQRVEGQPRKRAHLVALVVLVVDHVQPAVDGK